MTPVQGGLAVLGFGVTALAAAAGAVNLRDALGAGRRTHARRKRPLPVSRASDVRNLCAECRQPHPPELMPLELLVAGGVAVSPSRWFGRAR